MSRIFENLKEAISEIERDIIEMGIKVHTATMQNLVVKDNDDYSTLEVQNYSFTILDTSDKDIMNDDLEWCNAEFKERVSGEQMNPGYAWKIRESTWTPFLREGKMDYTYAARFAKGKPSFTQIEAVIKILKEDPDSRQAIIHMHMLEDVNKATNMVNPIRVPCSMYYQFMIRRGKLDVIYNMRSSDFYMHFKNDIWLADELRKYIAKAINIPCGLFHMNVGSLHIYKNYGHAGKHVF